MMMNSSQHATVTSSVITPQAFFYYLCKMQKQIKNLRNLISHMGGFWHINHIFHYHKQISDRKTVAKMSLLAPCKILIKNLY